METVRSKRSKKVEIPTPPRDGWINEIRTALSMPLRILAKRLNVDTSTVKRLEISEKNKTITLASLERAAHALHCKLYYVLTPDNHAKKMPDKF
jgi:transcriptional regulator with XRE-family HTH domain